MISFYNTLNNKTEAFTPIDDKNIRLYLCGPTVYGYAHIGNARAMVVFDTLFRLLRHDYGEEHVTYARNITDVDDKIIDISQQTGESIEDVTQRTTAAFHADLEALGCLQPTHEPRATAHIGDMVEMIEVLIAKGNAYAAEGHVLFAVETDPNYGCLSNRNQDDMIAGARVEVAPYKRNPMDFVLWKPSDDKQPGWDSPWGRGRPGWHIECSAMSKAFLGERFDIHAGGEDLIFPHHENEIAQSCCANDTDLMAQFWLHNGFLTVNGEKMSKSLGNFFTPHELLEEGFAGEVMRMSLLTGQYRAQMDFSKEKMAEVKTQLDRFYRILADNDSEGGKPSDAVLAALRDDINSPKAIAVLHELANAGDAKTLKASAAFLGVLQQDPEAWFKGDGGDDAEIDALIAARNDARANKDFAEADRIRDELNERGIVLEDASGATGWRRA